MLLLVTPTLELAKVRFFAWKVAACSGSLKVRMTVPTLRSRVKLATVGGMRSAAYVVTWKDDTGAMPLEAMSRAAFAPR